VFRVADGKVQLLATDLTGPNGLVFSPDEKFFYVDDWDVKKKVIMRYRVESSARRAASCRKRPRWRRWDRPSSATALSWSSAGSAR